MNPTAEQQAAVDLFATGQSLAIEAGAGTGKTSTLKLLAESTRQRGQYMAFNKAIVVEAGSKFPNNVRCSTAHSLAFREVGVKYKDRLNSSVRMKSYEIARRLGMEDITVEYDGAGKTLSRGFLASEVMRAVTIFCQTADAEPGPQHFRYIDGIDMPDEGRRTTYNNQRVRRHLLPALKQAWEDIQRLDGTLPFKHEHYLKLWQLGDPVINADFILFDEAQDANPVMVAIVAAQHHAQVVWVGDSQQQIYSFTGAVNALERVPADNRTFLTQSFRFGQDIADVANEVLLRLGAPFALQGNPDIDSSIEALDAPDAILTRTNATALETVLRHQQAGRSVHLVGGGADILAFARAAEELQRGQKTYHPELVCFADWAEVQDYVKNDAQGDDLKLLVTLVDKYGSQTIMAALSETTSERDADIVVSTAHKSKGREWDRVQLAGDFVPKPAKGEEEGRPLTDEEYRLLYVAVTRAKLALDVEAVATLLH